MRRNTRFGGGRRGGWLMLAVFMAVIAIGGPTTLGQTSKPARAALWLYMPTNHLVDANITKCLDLLDRAAKAGYTGVVVGDSKFMRWDSLPAKYVANCRRVRDAAKSLGLDYTACVCPIGYSNDLLGRDPNLAEGLPVVDAPFVVAKGELVPADDLKFANGGFEDHKGDAPAGWGFVDQPGKIAFIDTDVKTEGKSSLRMQEIATNDPQNGHARAMQALAVKPFRYYHVSAMVKTKDFAAAGDVRISVLGKDGASLQHQNLQLAKTQDWKRVDVCFNTLENTQVNLYLGVWGGKGGTLWWDDVRLEPGGLMNVVRRTGAPLKAVSEDGKTTFVEGKDFDAARDELLGQTPWAGGFTVWHKEPRITVPQGSSLRQGQRVLMSYYHTAIIYDDQVMCCMSEPKLYDIVAWQLAQVHKHLQPDAYFMGHDEIRVQGWDESCAARKLTCGAILADNVGRCAALVRKEDAGKPIYTWSDMFDPYHNAAKTGRYYLVKGEGPWQDSWKGLDKSIGIVNWNSGKSRIDSMRHFATIGCPQVLAGYYDGRPDSITAWLADAKGIDGVFGAMYTTWADRYDDIAAFAKSAKD